MKKTLMFFAVFMLACINLLDAQSVTIRYHTSSAQTRYAAAKLQETLSAKRYEIKAREADYIITLNIDSTRLPAEAYNLVPNNKTITITGGDARGLIYGSLAMAEALRNGTDLKNIKAAAEKSHLPFRAIKFDLPWDTYRHSSALDLHQSTCKDVNYWKAFLDMMVENRFNVLSLWNLHPYPYLIKAKNFPEACPFTEKEMQEWHQLFSSIFRMAKERGIDTYLIPFNIFVSPKFAKAHNVAMDNLEHDFFVTGDTSAIIKRYTRESVSQVLQEYPDLSGFGLTLGEGMAGMTPQQREDWMKETIVEGMRLAGRKTKLIHRIPFSSSTGSLDVTSIETEKLTRKEIEAQGQMDFLERPIWADLKYNWSHAHSTTKLVKVHGGKLYDTYFKPLPQTYKITWTARNEDFFCLRWGVPEFVRAHVNANSQSYVGGYFIGSETYIPATDYFTRIKGPVYWKYAFERQWLFYKLWGRLLYNPGTPDTLFSGEFIRRYGPKAAPLLEASALAGKTPLRLAADFDFTWDFSLYSEGFMALNPKTKSVEYISADRLIEQPALDPDYVSVKDYVKQVKAGNPFGKEKVTPPALAAMLEQDCNQALNLIKPIPVDGNNSLMYEVADVKVWAYLGLHFAEKIKGAVALQKYRTAGIDTNKQQAIRYFEKALSYWDEVVRITRPIYKEMPLTHFSEQNGNRSRIHDQLRFHWSIVRRDVAHDITIAKNAKEDLSR